MPSDVYSILMQAVNGLFELHCNSARCCPSCETFVQNNLLSPLSGSCFEASTVILLLIFNN